MGVSTSFHQAVTSSVIPSSNLSGVLSVKFSVSTHIGNMLLCFWIWDCFLWHEMMTLSRIISSNIGILLINHDECLRLLVAVHNSVLFISLLPAIFANCSTSTTSCWCYTLGSSFHYSKANSHISSFLWSRNKPQWYTILSETSSLKSHEDVVRFIMYFR